MLSKIYITLSSLILVSIVFTIHDPVFAETGAEQVVQMPAETPVEQDLEYKIFFPIIVTNPTTTTPDPEVDPNVLAVLEITNQRRAENGCGPLTLNNELNAAAYGHSEDMAMNDFFSHTGSDDSRFADRMTAAGYNYRGGGENIAAGYHSAESVMNGWMNSDGHRRNILNCSYMDIGIGFYYLANDTGSTNYRYYWTQDFGIPR